MKKFFCSRVLMVVLSVVCGAVLLGSSPWAVQAQDSVARLLGFRYSHQTLESYEMTPGISVHGTPKRPVKMQETRDQFNYPSYYGQLFSITGDQQGAVLWFVSPDGAIRNAVVDAPAARQLLLMPISENKLKKEVIRGSGAR